MNPAINYAIEELRHALKKHADPTAVHFALEVSSGGHSVTWQTKTPADLKTSGVSMRNLAGEFIKENMVCGKHHPTDGGISPCQGKKSHPGNHHGYFRDKTGEWEVEEWTTCFEDLPPEEIEDIEVPPPEVEEKTPGNLEPGQGSRVEKFLTNWAAVVALIRTSCVRRNLELLRVYVPDPMAKGYFAIDSIHIGFSESGVQFLHRADDGKYIMEDWT